MSASWRLAVPKKRPPRDGWPNRVLGLWTPLSCSSSSLLSWQPQQALPLLPSSGPLSLLKQFCQS